MRLRLNDDLVRTIDGGDAGIALNNSFAGGHLGAIGIGAVALADRTFAALAVMRMVGQPLTELCGFSPQAFDTLGGLLVQIGFDRQGVVLAVTSDHGSGGSFELVDLTGKIGTRTTLGFGCIAR